MVKRIFKIHSKLPKYAVVYDPDIVLQYAKSLLMRYRCISSTKFLDINLLLQWPMESKLWKTQGKQKYI